MFSERVGDNAPYWVEAYDNFDSGKEGIFQRLEISYLNKCNFISNYHRVSCVACVRSHKTPKRENLKNSHIKKLSMTH